MPGIKKTGNVTMKKGVFKSDDKFWDWFNQIKVNSIERVPVTISLLDESGSATNLSGTPLSLFHAVRRM